MHAREYVASVVLKNGGTESVIIKAHSAEEATKKLLELGYASVNWVL
jgi:hypothetical protein